MSHHGSCCMIYIDASGFITVFDLSGSVTDCSHGHCQMFHHFYCDCSCNGRTCCDCSRSQMDCSWSQVVSQMDCSWSSMDCSWSQMDCSWSQVVSSMDCSQSMAPYMSSPFPVDWSYKPFRADPSGQDLSGVRRLLLLDSRVRGYAYFLGCRKPNVDYVVLTYSRDTVSSLLRWIGLYHTQFESVAYLSNGYDDFYFSFLWKEESSILKMVERLDPSMVSWNSFAGFISDISGICGIKYFDFLGDSVYSHSYWRYVIAGLQEKTGVTIRASIDITGNADVSGNWILEHGDVNLRDVYFNDNILAYPYHLHRGS